MTWNTFWAAASALMGFLMVLLFILDRQTSALTVATVSTAVLVDLSDPRLSSLKLTYKDISVSRLTVATFEVRNTGTRPIEEADFDLPPVIRFKNPSDVLAVTLNEKKTPLDLKPLISSDDRGIHIAPLLLNPGDQFQITVQLRGDFNEPTVEARILGVPSISRETLHEELDPTRRGLIQIAIGVVLLFIYFYFWLLFAFPSRGLRPVKPMSILGSMVVGVALGIGGATYFAAGASTLRLSDTEMWSWAAVVFLLSVIVLLPFAWPRRRANGETLGRGDGTQPH